MNGITAQAAEQSALERWRLAGETLTPAAFVAGQHRGRAVLIVATFQLGTAVAALLDEQGIPTEPDRTRRDPGAPGSAEVIPLRGRHGGHLVLAFLLPGQPVIRIYEAPENNVDLDPAATPLEVLTLDAGEPTPSWIPAAILAAHLADYLDPATESSTPDVPA
jgi:hypothetical protein